MGVKSLVKKVLPKSVVDFIKTEKQKIIVQKSNDANLKYLDIINTRKKDKIVVVFVCQMSALWNSLKSVYEASCNNSLIETYVIALPEKKFNDEKEYEKNKAFIYLNSLKYKNIINGFNEDINTFFEITSLNPDYIFLPRPYEHYMPEEYQTSKLVKYTRVCYINYGYNLTNWANKITYDISFLKNVYFTFADSQDSLEHVRKLYTKNKCSWNKVEYLGYPRFDLVKKVDNNKKIKSFLWTPRWTTSESLLGSNFFNYKNQLFNFFINNKDLTFIFRPHPLMIRNFLKTGEMTQKEVDNLYRLFDENENFIFDTNEDYLKTFEQADVLISDTSSIIAEYYYTGKPIIYCGVTEDFINETKEMIKSFYYVKNQQQLIDAITSLKNTTLSRKEKNLNSNMNIGQSIVKRIIEDYRGNKQ